MEIAIWVIQGILAAMFLAAGIMKSTRPKEKLAASMPWVNDFSPAGVKLIGIAELLGAVGLVVPYLTGIAPVLTPIAALSLALIMVLAATYHLRKKEYKPIGLNLILLVLLLIVAYRRY